jgi:hypothetical protein
MSTIDQQLTNNWPTIDQQLTNNWPIVDRQLTNSWPTVDRQLTDSWPTVDQQLTKNWPTIDQQLTNNWPTIGPQLTDNWPTVDRQLTDSWPTVDQQLTNNWPTVYRCDWMFSHMWICTYIPMQVYHLVMRFTLSKSQTQYAPQHSLISSTTQKQKLFMHTSKRCKNDGYLYCVLCNIEVEQNR